MGRKSSLIGLAVLIIISGCAGKEEMRGESTIIGVVKSGGKPVEGAKVEIIGISSCITGADGVFKLIGLYEGSYEISVEKEGYVRKVFQVSVGPEALVNIGDIEIELAGKVEGIAVIEGEKTHKGIRVRVLELEGMETETDSEGKYSIGGLPPGIYTLEISAPGFYRPKRVSVSVKGGEVSEAEGVRFVREIPGMENLILYYSFEPEDIDIEKNKIKDKSPRGNDGAIHGGAKPVPAKVGQGMGFDGTGHIEIPYNNSLDCTEGVTIATWFNCTELRGFAGGRWAAIVTKGRMFEPSENYGFYISVVSQEAYFQLAVTIDGLRRVFNSHSLAYTVNNWYYVVMTFDGTNWAIYINGNLSTSRSLPGKMAANTFPLWIGRGHSGVDDIYFVGVLDELMVYNRGLKEEEVKELSMMMGAMK